MRIPTLLQKIGELAEHPDRRTRIDVDLMLDYTRVLYADLLEWRDKLSAPAPNPVSAPIPATTRSSGPAPGPASPASNAEPNVPPGAQSTAMPDQRHRSFQRPASMQPPSTESSKGTSDISKTTPLPAKEPTLAELAAAMDHSEEDAEPVYQTVRPQPNNAAAANLTPPAFSSRVPPTTAAKTAAAAINAAVAPKDIRSNISINEKYQIMSELFGNDKSAYETAMDKINTAESESAAIKWLQEQLWVTEERGEAMQQFFEMVRRFKSQPEQGSLRFNE
jgi:hypothetical protein